MYKVNEVFETIQGEGSYTGVPAIFIRLSGVISNVAVGFGFFFLAQRIWQMAERSLRRGVVTEFLGIPVAYFVQFISVMMCVSAVILIIVAVRNLLQKTKGVNAHD